MTISVKVAVVPGAVTEVVLEDGATVADALSAAGVDNSENYPITVGGARATNSTVLLNDARVILAKSSKSA